MANTKFLSHAFQENRGVRGYPRSDHCESKKDTKTSDHQSSESPPKLIRSFFPYKSYIPPGHNLQPLSRGLWVVVIFKDIIFGTFNYVEQNGYLKIFLDVLGEMMGMGGGVSYPPISVDY